MTTKSGFLGKQPVYYVYRKHNNSLAWKGTLKGKATLDKLKQAFPSNRYYIKKDNTTRLANPYIYTVENGKGIVRKRSNRKTTVKVKQRKKR